MLEKREGKNIRKRLNDHPHQDDRPPKEGSIVPRGLIDRAPSHPSLTTSFPDLGADEVLVRRTYSRNEPESCCHSCICFTDLYPSSSQAYHAHQRLGPASQPAKDPLSRIHHLAPALLPPASPRTTAPAWAHSTLPPCLNPDRRPSGGQHGGAGTVRLNRDHKSVSGRCEQVDRRKWRHYAAIRCWKIPSARFLDNHICWPDVFSPRHSSDSYEETPSSGPSSSSAQSSSSAKTSTVPIESDISIIGKRSVAESEDRAKIDQCTPTCWSCVGRGPCSDHSQEQTLITLNMFNHCKLFAKLGIVGLIS
jgi:hypothetical protein